MTGQSLKPGLTFRSTYVEEDLFIFCHPCSIVEGEGLFRRFNMAHGFIEQDWYRFKLNAEHLKRAGEFHISHG